MWQSESVSVSVCGWGGGGADTVLKLETISRQRPLCWHQRKENLYCCSSTELLVCLVYWRFWWFSPVRRSCPKASGCQTISFQEILFKSIQGVCWQHRGCKRRHSSWGAASAGRHSLHFWEWLWSLHSQMTSWHADDAQQVENSSWTCNVLVAAVGQHSLRDPMKIVCHRV